MEHESFEDEATAKLLNEAFVCVKVDREERPDVDRVYMSAVQMTGPRRLAHDRPPDARRPAVLRRTYLPRSSSSQISASQIQRAWKDDSAADRGPPTRLAEQAPPIGDGSPTTPGDRSTATPRSSRRCATNDSAPASTHRHGGYGRPPKFPPHTELLYHLERDGSGRGGRSAEQVYATLDAMARGGIHDQVGGGFHRYSTDERWLLPHFEKMLYDNALLAQAYQRGAYAHTRKTRATGASSSASSNGSSAR